MHVPYRIKTVIKGINKELNLIRRDIEDLDLPTAGYSVVWFNSEKLHIAEFGANAISYYKNIDKERNMGKFLLSWFHNQTYRKNIKFIAAEIVGDKWLKNIISDLWLKEDIVPYFTKADHFQAADIRTEYVRNVVSRFDTENIIKVRTLDYNKVEISELVLADDYKKITKENEFNLLLNLARDFKGKKILFINATPQGGGVALMRHSLMRLFNLLDVDASWHVLYPLKEAFDITKIKFHNVLQAVASKETVLTEKDKSIYNAWLKDNFEQLKDIIEDKDVVVIDDPQPSGLVPYIKKLNPKVKIIYRSHIQIEAKLADKKGTPQNITWQFIWDNIKDSDLFVVHPIKQFVPKSVDPQKVVMMPATTDNLDGLNKPLSFLQADYYLKLFDKILLERNQTLLDKRRSFIIQVARFDPSKGIPDVIESYRILRQKLEKKHIKPPQLVIVGNVSIDDPDGIPVLNLVMELLRDKRYRDFANDIKVAKLPSVDQILNVLLSEAKVALQLSHKEGFEVKVTEALMKGVPVVAYKAGGIPLQIKDGVSGYLVEVGDVEGVADKLYDLFINDELYYSLRRGAVENINPQTSTVSNVINWLFLANELVKGNKIIGNGRNVKELIAEKFNL